MFPLQQTQYSNDHILKIITRFQTSGAFVFKNGIESFATSRAQTYRILQIETWARFLTVPLNYRAR